MQKLYIASTFDITNSFHKSQGSAELPVYVYLQQKIGVQPLRAPGWQDTHLRLSSISPVPIYKKVFLCHDSTRDFSNPGKAANTDT